MVQFYFFSDEFLAVEWFSFQRIHTHTHTHIHTHTHTQAVITTVTISSSFHPYPSFLAHDSYFVFALNGKPTRRSFTSNKISTFLGRSLCRAGFVRVFWEDLFKSWILSNFMTGAKIRLLVGTQHISDLCSTFSHRDSCFIKDNFPSKYVAQYPPPLVSLWPSAGHGLSF